MNDRIATAWLIATVDGEDFLILARDRDAYLAEHPGATFRAATEEDIADLDQES